MNSRPSEGRERINIQVLSYRNSIERDITGIFFFVMPIVILFILFIYHNDDDHRSMTKINKNRES